MAAIPNIEADPSTNPEPSNHVNVSQQNFAVSTPFCSFLFALQATLEGEGHVHASGDHKCTANVPTTTLYALEKTIQGRREAMEAGTGAGGVVYCAGFLD